MGEGFWTSKGVTASVDWCEPNYVVSPYVAEWWNTLSSLPIAALGMLGMVLALRATAPVRFVVGFAVMAVIGWGSAGFHGTLLAAAQASDELPMVYLSLVFAYILRWRHAPDAPDPQTRAAMRRWMLGLGLYGVVFTALYFSFEAYFQLFIWTYAAIVTYLVVQTLRLSFGAQGHPTERRLFLLSGGVYVGGVGLLWIPEHVLLGCEHPAQAFQLHAFFHLTSAVGTYAWLLWALHHRSRALGEEVSLTLWPPYLGRPRRSAPA